MFLLALISQQSQRFQYFLTTPDIHTYISPAPVGMLVIFAIHLVAKNSEISPGLTFVKKKYLRDSSELGNINVKIFQSFPLLKLDPSRRLQSLMP